jgi:hypothetical protein
MLSKKIYSKDREFLDFQLNIISNENDADKNCNDAKRYLELYKSF